MIIVSLKSSNVAIWDSTFIRCRVGLGLNSVCQIFFLCHFFSSWIIFIKNLMTSHTGNTKKKSKLTLFYTHSMMEALTLLT